MEGEREKKQPAETAPETECVLHRDVEELKTKVEAIILSFLQLRRVHRIIWCDTQPRAHHRQRLERTEKLTRSVKYRLHQMIRNGSPIQLIDVTIALPWCLRISTVALLKEMYS